MVSLFYNGGNLLPLLFFWDTFYAFAVASGMDQSYIDTVSYTHLESSSGNFGISLAMIGAAKGYRVIILVDPKTTATNLALLKCFGAEVIVVTEQDDSGSYHKTRISLANKLASEIPVSYTHLPQQISCHKKLCIPGSA